MVRSIKEFVILMPIVLLSVCLQAQTLFINEFMSENVSTIADFEGDYSDWIEIFNASTESINLEGYFITDNSQIPDKWVFPSVEIPSKGLLLVFASGKNRDSTDELHTNFSINKEGEVLILSTPNLSIIHSIQPVALAENQSYGCIPDGSANMGVLTLPTPYQYNRFSHSVFCSHESGFYQSPFNIQLIASDNDVEIRYTINGNDPNSESPLYNDEIAILKNTDLNQNISLIPTTPLVGPYQLNDFVWKSPQYNYLANVIRFAAFRNDSLISEIHTRVFFVDESIFTRFKYPVVSVVTDSMNLFDYNRGIYVPGQTFDDLGWSWWPYGNYHCSTSECERGAYISYFEPNGTIAFETNAGIRMRGYGSAVMPQKSFVIYFRNEYGINKISYPIFKNDPNNTFKRLIFRNSGGDFIKTHFRDALIQDIMSSMDLEYQRFRPSVVFINGEYWGIHNIREKYDKYYFHYNFGVDESDINILGVCGYIEQGDNSDYHELVNFISNHDLRIASNYYYVKSKIDIINFIDFQIAEIYFANYDWPCNNYKMWKTNSPESKWRFLIYDLDYSFDFDSYSEYDAPSLEHALSEDTDWPYCECSNIIFRKLIENQEFKDDFLFRFYYHLSNTLSPEKISDRINYFTDLFEDEIEEHILRWGYPEDMSCWYYEINKLLYFAENRYCFFSDYIKDYFRTNFYDFDCHNAQISSLQNQIVIAPNPNQGVFSLINISTYQYKIELNIFNLLGQLVYHEENLLLSPETIHRVDVQYLPKNFYILDFSTDHETIRRKFIIE